MMSSSVCIIWIWGAFEIKYYILIEIQPFYHPLKKKKNISNT